MNVNFIKNINNNYNVQINQFSNPLNIKVTRYDNFDNEMIDYGITIINKAFSIMNDYNQIAKYVCDSFGSKYPGKTKWNCIIIQDNTQFGFCISHLKAIEYSIDDKIITIFLAG